MITENPLIDFVALEVFNEDLEAWEPWTPALNSLQSTRGGVRSGVSTTVEPGLMVATLLNAGDPLADPRLRPNLPIRLTSHSEPLFTGLIQDLDTEYVLDKSTGELRVNVTLTAVDAVASHANTKRYGAVVEDGIGYETWAQRINRLAASAITPWEPPENDTPTVIYGV